MNKERILLLADALETASLAKEGKLGFNMGVIFDKNHHADYTHHNCGTVGCLVGWTVGVFEPDHFDEVVSRRDLYPSGSDCIHLYKQAKDILEIDGPTSESLFMPDGFHTKAEKYTPKRAVKTLRNLAETGEVVW